MELTYYLPETRVRITGTVRTTTDSILEKTIEEPRDVATAWEVAADQQAEKDLRAEGRGWSDVELDLQFSDDRRVVGASVAVDSAGPELLKAAATIGGAALGALVGGWPGAAVGGTLAGGARPGINLMEILSMETQPIGDVVGQAYALAHPNEADAARNFRALKEALDVKVLEVRLSIAADPADQGLSAQLSRLSRVSADVDRDLAKLKEHFVAWRSTTLSVSDETIDAVFEVRHLPRFEEGGSLVFPDARDSTAPIKAEEVWNRLNVAIAYPAGSLRDRPDEQVHGGEPPEGIWVRVPHERDFVELANVDGVAKTRRRFRRLVFDDRSLEEFFDWGHGFFKDRKLGLEFSPTGALSKISRNDSGAHDIAEALGAVPGLIGGGVTTASDIRTTLDALHNANRQREIDNLKRQVEAKQQEFILAGLASTEADHAELERLKQIVSIAEQRSVLAGLPPSLLEGLLPVNPAWWPPPGGEETADQPPSARIEIVVRPPE